MTTRSQTTPTQVVRDIDKWTHVFVRNDAVRGPLNSPYLGPFRVLSQAKKYFMNGRTEIVSVDRLKKTHFEWDITDLNVVDTNNFNPLWFAHTYTLIFVSIHTWFITTNRNIIQNQIRKDGTLAEETVQDLFYLIRLVSIYIFCYCLCFTLCAVRLVVLFFLSVQHHVLPTFVQMAELL